MRFLRIPLGLLALLSTGCELGLRVDVDVDRNGRGVLAVAVTADEELLALAEQSSADPLDELVAAAEALAAEGWRVSDRTEDTGNGATARTVTLAAEFADAEEFNALSAELAETLAADEVRLLEPFTLEVTDDELVLAGAASARPRKAVRDYGLTRQEAVRLMKESEAFRYDVAVTFPGEVTEATADVPEGSSTPVWSVAPGERVVIAATGTRPGPPILRAVAGAAAGAAAAGGVLWLVARRRRRL